MFRPSAEPLASPTETSAALAPLRLDEARSILERREQLARGVAARTAATRFAQASNDEASFFLGLRGMIDELEFARTRLHGDPTRPLKRLRQTTKIALVISGGSLMQVLANGQQVEVMLLDYDGDGHAPLTPIPQADGSCLEALVSRPKVEVDARLVAELFGLSSVVEQQVETLECQPPTL